MSPGINPYRFRDYRSYLKAIFELRKQRNASYSIRAFARDLAFHPSRLSLVLRRLSHLSLASLQKILTRLDLPEPDRHYLIVLHQRDHSPATQRPALLREQETLRQANRFQRFDQSLLKRLDWRHFVCLFLLEETRPTPTPESVAQRMQISPKLLRKLITELQDSGMLQSKHSDCNTSLHTFAEESSAAIRKFHRGLIERGLEAMDVLPIQERYVRSLIVQIPNHRYQVLVRLIEEFLQHCYDHVDDSDQPQDEIFALSVQLFPLLPETKKTESNDSDASFNGEACGLDNGQNCRRVESGKNEAAASQRSGSKDRPAVSAPAMPSN